MCYWLGFVVVWVKFGWLAVCWFGCVVLLFGGIVDIYYLLIVLRIIPC